MPISFVHVGAGSLGLGLVVPALARTGTCIHVVNRKSRKHTYRLLKKRRSYLQLTPPNQNPVSFHSFSTLDALPSRLADGECCVLTTAVRVENLASLGAVLAQSVRQRMGANPNSPAPLFVIACENAHSNSEVLRRTVEDVDDLSFQAYLDTRVHFLNCVVDKMCDQPTVTGQGKARQAVVRVESFEEWIVDASKLPAELVEQFTRLVAGSGIRVVTNHDEFDFFEHRKTWLVNGSLLALSVYANRHGPPYLTASEALADREIQRRLGLVQQVLATALSVYGTKELQLLIPEAEIEGVNGIAAYCRQLNRRLDENGEYQLAVNLRDLLRLNEVDNSIEGVLRTLSPGIRLGRRQAALRILLSNVDLWSFLRKAGDRIFEPISFLLEHDANVPSGSRFLPQMQDSIIEIVSLMTSLYLIMQERTRVASETIKNRLSHTEVPSIGV